MNLSAIQDALQAQGLDGWLFFDHHHRDPLAYRILGLASDTHASRRWFYYVPANGGPRGLVHRIEPNVLAELPGSRLQYSRWSELSVGVEQLLSGAKRIAMQYSPGCAIPYVSVVDAGTVEMIRSFGLEVVTSADLVQRFEAAWSGEQIDLHLEAGRRVDAVRRGAFQWVTEALRAGRPITEWEVRVQILERFAKEGLSTGHGPIVAVNGNASNPHYEPSRHHHSPIQPGDVLLIDLWARLDQPNAVYYDVTWTGYCGVDIPGEVQRVFEIVRDARDTAVRTVQEAARSGTAIAGFEVDDAARAHITSQGYGDYFVHRTGHSIGTDVHGAGANMDNFETHDERTIIANTCFSVEPGIYLPNFGIRSEVNVLHRGADALVTGEAQTQLVQIA